METLVMIAVVAFIAWNERDRIAAMIAKFKPAEGEKQNGPPVENASVTRAEAVEAVEKLLEYARQNGGMPELERHARDAGRSLWDCKPDEPEED